MKITMRRFHPKRDITSIAASEALARDAAALTQRPSKLAMGIISTRSNSRASSGSVADYDESVIDENGASDTNTQVLPIMMLLQQGADPETAFFFRSLMKEFVSTFDVSVSHI